MLCLAACAGPTAPTATLGAGNYLLTISTDRRSDGSVSCLPADGIGGLISATVNTAVRVEGDGAGVRGVAASSDGGTVSFTLTISTGGSTTSAAGNISGTAIAISRVSFPVHPDEVAFGGAPDGPATLQGIVEKTGTASGKVVGGVTHTLFDPLGVFFCHNTNTTWKLTPQ